MCICSVEGNEIDKRNNKRKIFSQTHRALIDSAIKPPINYEWTSDDAVDISAKGIVAKEKKINMLAVAPDAHPFVNDVDEEKLLCPVAGESRECRQVACVYGERCVRRFFARMHEFGPIQELRYLQVLPAGAKGFGLFTIESVVKNQPLTLYNGLRWSFEEGAKRRQKFDEHGLTCYQMAAEPTNNVLSMREATVIGTTFRFANHACGNAATAYVEFWPCGGGKRKSMLRAKEDMPKGTEVTYEYDFDIDNDELRRMQVFGEGLPSCHCKGPECTKYMGYSRAVVETAKRNWYVMHTEEAERAGASGENRTRRSGGGDSDPKRQRRCKSL